MKAIDQPGVLGALQAIRARAADLEGQPGYHMASVRSLAVDLGYAALLPAILQACAEGGFSYCLDYTVAATSYGGGGEHTSRPTQAVCVWGADQLRSRLDCVDYRLARGA